MNGSDMHFVSTGLWPGPGDPGGIEVVSAVFGSPVVRSAYQRYAKEVYRPGMPEPVLRSLYNQYANLARAEGLTPVAALLAVPPPLPGPRQLGRRPTRGRGGRRFGSFGFAPHLSAGGFGSSLIPEVGVGEEVIVTREILRGAFPGVPADAPLVLARVQAVSPDAVSAVITAFSVVTSPPPGQQFWGPSIGVSSWSRLAAPTAPLLIPISAIVARPVQPPVVTGPQTGQAAPGSLQEVTERTPGSPSVVAAYNRYVAAVQRPGMPPAVWRSLYNQYASLARAEGLTPRASPVLLGGPRIGPRYLRSVYSPPSPPVRSLGRLTVPFTAQIVPVTSMVTLAFQPRYPTQEEFFADGAARNDGLSSFVRPIGGGLVVQVTQVGIPDVPQVGTPLALGGEWWAVTLPDGTTGFLPRGVLRRLAAGEAPAPIPAPRSPFE